MARSESPEHLHSPNSKAFDWDLSCLKHEGQLRAIRVVPARHEINQRWRSRQNCL
ncbi:hypothetical protein QUA71_08550 [Microcoleus sp. MON1_C5]|uniref:hypothetical protein n=1 Tax=Microcoleus sp. MON1_C5 TaxID=2818828 RepID=UPI002FCFC05F